MDDHYGRGGSIEEAVADGGDVVVLKNLEFDQDDQCLPDSSEPGVVHGSVACTGGRQFRSLQGVMATCQGS